MKSEVKYGNLVYSDGTISKKTMLCFEEEEAMWRYYDSLESDSKASINIHNKTITLNEEYVPIAEYRDFKFGVSEEE